jgi:DMSO reductase anchor subunit
VKKDRDPGETRGDVRASTDGDTYIHGDSPGPGPKSTQEARSGVGRDRGAKEIPMVPKDKPRTYYDRPVVKEPVWKPEIPWYFFTGGLGGASSALAYLASITGNRTLARRAWAISFGAISISPVLLIADLGRPERFFNMLRVFKVSSPMSVGSWLLMANSLSVAPAAAASLIGFPKGLGRRAAPVAAVLGMPLTTYTAVLISNSAIPVWSEARRELPLVFAAGGAASAGAAAAMTTPTRYAGPARRLAIGGAVAELAAGQLMDRRLGELSKPYKEGEAATYEKLSKGLTLAGAALMTAGSRRRSAAMVGGALLLAGAVCKRWSIFKAGFGSAADPHQTVGPQRQRVEERKREAEIEETAITG